MRPDAILSPDVIESIPDAVVAVNQDGLIVQVNSQTEALFGYTRDELIGQSVEILVPETKRQQHRSHRKDFHQEPRVRRMGSGLDLHGKRRDGSEFPVEVSLSPVFSDLGTITLSAIRDVSDRRRVEQELRHANEELEKRKSRELRDSQSRLALIIDSTQDAIIGETLEGVVTHWNRGAEEMFGFSAQEMIGRSASFLAPQECKGEEVANLERIRGGERVEYFESLRVRKDGKPLDVSVTISPIRDTEGKVIGASTIARNISAQKRVENQLRQSQKMEAIGRLAGGVAHDFNNLLSIVGACSELVREHVGPGGLEYIDNIGQATKRGTALTRQLLAFSRRQTTKPEILSMKERLKEIHKLLRPLMGDDVEIVLGSAPEDAFVMIDPSHWDQVVVNLAVNARDAMPKGGKLAIETKLFNCDAGFAQEHPPMKPGVFVMVAVSDNGTGMDEVTRTRIFEPFFTTKEIGKGSGLGLATVYGIVNQAGGCIFVYSELGQGTTFKIYLPSAERAMNSDDRPVEALLPQRREGVTVLLAEDEAMMRTVTSRILQAHGYKVLEAEDGSAAWRLARSYKDKIDLVLTDVVMKGMTGPELVLKMMDPYPTIKIVYTSGYTGEILNRQGLNGIIRFLDKPFTRADLLNTLDAALNQ